jgi:hypothetical protein
MPIPEFKNWFEVIEFEDYEGLTDEEMLELNDLQLEALEKVQAVNPAITDEMIREFKTHVNKVALASAREKPALKAEAIAKRNLDASWTIFSPTQISPSVNHSPSSPNTKETRNGHVFLIIAVHQPRRSTKTVLGVRPAFLQYSHESGDLLLTCAVGVGERNVCRLAA